MPLPGSAEDDREGLLVVAPRGRQHCQSLLEFVLEFDPHELDLLHLLQLDGLEAVVGEKVEEFAGIDAHGGHRRPFHADDLPHHDDAAFVRHFDFLAAHLMEQLPDRGVLRHVHGERFERGVDGHAVVVGDGADFAAILIREYEALEQVVDVGFVEAKIEAGIAGDLAFAVEVADAGVEKHDAGDRQVRAGRQLRVGGRCFEWGRFRLAVAPRQRCEEKQPERQRDDREQERGSHVEGSSWGKGRGERE